MRSHLSAITVGVLVSPALLTFATAPAEAAAPRCRGLTATIVGTPDRDTINGTSGDDVIVGRAGPDIIDGGGGDDVICGNRGWDKIDGGGGNDRVRGHKGADELVGGSGNDALSGGVGRWTTFVADAGDDDYRSDTVGVVVDFSAAPGPVSVDLGAGISSGWGNDTFDFGHSGAHVRGSSHSDTLVGSDRSDHLVGVAGFDTIKGKGGSDVLAAEQGVILGGDDTDYLKFEDMTPDSDLTADGGSGNDTMELGFDESGLPEGLDLAGGDGNDKLVISPWDGFNGGTVTFDLTFNMTTGAFNTGGTDGIASGFERLGGGGFVGSVDVVGTDGPNEIAIVSRVGTAATLRGLAGDDVIKGGFADDSLYGGLGDDKADGGEGTDTCASIEHATSCEILNP